MINVAGIVEDSIVDGPGLRFAIFGQGCPHHCPDCHNPETWEFSIGTNMDEEQLLEIINKNLLCRAVTLSGGEPFAQAEGFAKLAGMLKAAGYEVAAYTGYTFEQLMHGTAEQKALLEALDVLIDGPFVSALRSMDNSFRGSSNQRILNIKESLRQGKAINEISPRWSGIY